MAGYVWREGERECERTHGSELWPPTGDTRQGLIIVLQASSRLIVPVGLQVG